MSGYVDIHAHVLPGIDDGPEDLKGSLAMARAASEAGIWTLAATPHLRSDFPNVHIRELSERCAEVSQAIEREQIPVRLVGGAEVSLIWAFDADDEELKLASYRQAGSDLLVETPLTGVIGLQQHLYELRLRGMRVTLAHPERSADFQRDPGKVEALVDQGIMLQVNAGSLLAGERNSGVRRLAEHLCTSGQATVAGVRRPSRDGLAPGDEACPGGRGGRRARSGPSGPNGWPATRPRRSWPARRSRAPPRSPSSAGRGGCSAGGRANISNSRALAGSLSVQRAFLRREGQPGWLRAILLGP